MTFSQLSKKTVLNLEDLLDEGLNYAVNSYLAKFFITDKNGLTTGISNYTTARYERRKPENRECIKIEIDSFNDATLIKSHSIQLWFLDQILLGSLSYLSKTGSGSIRDDIFCSSMWLDPRFRQLTTLLMVWRRLKPPFKTLLILYHLQVLKNNNYTLNGALLNNHCFVHKPGIPRNMGENLCIPMYRISKYLFVSRGDNDDVFFKYYLVPNRRSPS